MIKMIRPSCVVLLLLALLGNLNGLNSRSSCAPPISSPGPSSLGWKQGGPNSRLGNDAVPPAVAAVLRLVLRGGSALQFLGPADGGSPLGTSQPPPQAGNNADLLSQLSKDTLQAELERRGFDSVGSKSVLAIRLNRVMAEAGSPGPGLQQPVSNAGGMQHSQDGEGRAGEGDMMDVDAAGKSAVPPKPAMRRMEGRGERRASHLEQRGRRGNLVAYRTGGVREREGGRDGARSWEGLKSGSMKVSTPPAKKGPFRSTRGGREMGDLPEGGSSAHPGAGDAGNWQGAGEGHGQPYPTRRPGGRQRGSSASCRYRE